MAVSVPGLALSVKASLRSITVLAVSVVGLAFAVKASLGSVVGPRLALAIKAPLRPVTVKASLRAVVGPRLALSVKASLRPVAVIAALRAVVGPRLALSAEVAAGPVSVVAASRAVVIELAARASAAAAVLLAGVIALALTGSANGAVRRLKAHFGNHDVASGGSFDGPDGLRLLQSDQAHGFAGGSGTARAADAVNIVFAGERKVEVHDQRDHVHVNAAGGDVGGGENAVAAVLEALEGSLALGEGAVGVNLGGAVVAAPQHGGQLAGAVAGAGEDEHRAVRILIQQA